METLYRTIAIIFTVALMGFAYKAYAWEHTVIMFPPEGSSFTVPLVPDARNCVYVTDCSEQIGTQPTPTEPEPVISDIPNIRGIDGWSFGVPIDRAGWTLETDGEHEAAVNAIDGNPGTIWRTGNANTQAHPHHIIIDMQSEHWVDGLIYSPRPYDDTVNWSENGNLTGYEVWVSTDKNAWGRVADGELVYTTTDQSHTIDFLYLIRFVM